MSKVESANNRSWERENQTSNAKHYEKGATQFAQLMKTSNRSSSNKQCRFSQNDKLLTVSVDDLGDTPKKMKALTDYLKSSGIPVTLFPHSGTNEDNLNKMTQLPNAKIGWHGKVKGKLDSSPIPGTDRSVIAWSYGLDSEGRKNKLGTNTIARGTKADRGSIKINEFDQHDLPSFTIKKGSNSYLKDMRQKVLNEGGIISLHLHNSDGIEKLKTTVRMFRTQGGKIIHLDQLKGCGK